MLRQFTGLCAAAALLAMSGAAHALKIFDTAPADRAALVAATANDSYTYASETLLTNATTEVKGDSTKYYHIGGTASLVLSVPADVGAVGDDTYLVSVSLDGMVFRTALTAASLVSAGTTWTVATGGAAGDKAVVFRKLTGTLDAAAANLDLTVQFAVSEGGGSATVTLTNQSVAALNVPNLSGTKTHGPANVIKVASALKETVVTNDLTASVESSFKKFKGATAASDDVTVGHVGSITIGFNGHRIATSNDGATGVVDGLEDILVTGQTTGTTPTANSSLSFMGDFSFTEKVFMHGDADCGASDDSNIAGNTDVTLAAAEPDLRIMEGTGDDAVVTNTTKAVNLDATPTDDTDVLTGYSGYLCIMVQGDDTDDKDAPRIPDTDAYTAMGSYKALTNAASGPTGMERMLGEINRDGTTAHIPYLTTYEGYNQRIVLSNRSSSPADYEMEFRPEAGVTATATDMATGTLMGNTTVTMKATDLVTLEGGSRTAATIILEGLPANIDVTSVTVNAETRGTDTVVHHSM